MKTRRLLLLLLLFPLTGNTATDAYMTWQVNNASGLASSWQLLQFDVGIGVSSFALHGAAIDPSNHLALTGTCVYRTPVLIFCKANFSRFGVEINIQTGGPELQLDFTTFDASHIQNGGGSAVLSDLGYLN